MNDKFFKAPFKLGLHDWQKTGKLKSKSLGGEHYTSYKCGGCGLEARMHKKDKSRRVLTIVANFNRREVQACKSPLPFTPPQRIRVIHIRESSAGDIRFKNCVPDSIHSTTKPAGWFYHDHLGVWIQGHGTVVKLFNDEFEPLPNMTRKVKKKKDKKKKDKKKNHVTFHRSKS